MNKAILVIDKIPKNCMECILCCCDRDFDYICSALSTKAELDDDFTNDTFMVVSEEECWKVGERYSECPLKPLPSREDIHEEIYQAYGLGKEEPYVRMRDAVDKVLDEIVGEEQ